MTLMESMWHFSVPSHFGFSFAEKYILFLIIIFFYACCRGIILFRPPHLSNKFEDGSVKFTEDKFTSAKIKKFIQDNMYVLAYDHS